MQLAVELLPGIYFAGKSSGEILLKIFKIRGVYSCEGQRVKCGKSHLCGVHPAIPRHSDSPRCETSNGSPRFASIYFSCAPENQGKPPGGQAAEAEKIEETAAATEAQKEVTVPGETVARCLYENIEYSGTLAGSQAHTQNLTECQVSCLHV